VITGYAYVPDATQPGQLNVHFDSTKQGDAPYWVLELGPVYEGKYDYAIVSDNLSAFLFVLARDVKRFQARYDLLVNAHLKEYGFIGPKSAIATYQASDCIYESTLRAKEIAENEAKAK